MNTLFVISLIFFSSLAGLQLRGGLRNLDAWAKPVFPLVDSPWRTRLRRWMVDIGLSAFLAVVVLCFIVALDLFGRLAVGLI
jgi:hypothetical protein